MQCTRDSKKSEIEQVSLGKHLKQEQTSERKPGMLLALCLLKEASATSCTFFMTRRSNDEMNKAVF